MIIDTLTSEAARLGGQVTERATDVARQGAQWARDGSERVLLEAARATDRARGYVRQRPARSLLVAVGTGALLVVLARALAGRSR
jgi:hypothetical protein